MDLLRHQGFVGHELSLSTTSCVVLVDYHHYSASVKLKGVAPSGPSSQVEGDLNFGLLIVAQSLTAQSYLWTVLLESLSTMQGWSTSEANRDSQAVALAHLERKGMKPPHSGPSMNDLTDSSSPREDLVSPDT